MPTLRPWSPLALMLLAVAGCSEAPPIVGAAPPGGAAEVESYPPAEARRRQINAQTDEIVAEAVSTLRNGDLAGAAKLLEEAVKRDPFHRQALAMLAMIDVQRGNDLERPKSSDVYIRAGEAARQLMGAYRRELNERERTIIRDALYHEARTFAFLKKEDHALNSLAEAVKEGYANVEAIQTEPELDPLRKTPRFRAIVAEVEAAARTRAAGEASRRLAEKPPFPFDFKLKGLDDKTLALADLRGKVVLVDFWGTWCPPCRQEIPHLAELYKKFHDKGLEVVGINYEKEEGAGAKAKVESFVKEHGIPYPCLIGDDGTQERLGGINGFPTTILVDRSGRGRVKVEGFAPELVYVFEDLVTTLLAEPATAPKSN